MAGARTPYARAMNYPPVGRPSTKWVLVTAAMAVMSVLFTLAGAACALVSLAFFDDPSAPGAVVALVGMLVFAACCAATLALPPLFWLWGRGGGDDGRVSRRLAACAVGYLVPVLVGTIQFTVLMR